MEFTFEVVAIDSLTMESINAAIEKAEGNG